MRVSFKKYDELSLKKKRELVNKRLDYEYIIGEDFDGDLEKEIEVIHKKCNTKDYISLKELFLKKIKCEECYRIKKEKEFKELIKGKYELKSKYYNNKSIVKVLIKKCNHIQKVRSSTVTLSVKNDTNIRCDTCMLEQKIKTIKKHLKVCSTYENEYIFKSLKDDIVEIFHSKCKQTLTFTYSNVIHDNIRCYSCKEEHKQEWFENKLRKKYKVSTNFKMYKKYINSKNYIYLQHKCGHIKRLKIISLEFLDDIKCDVCELDRFRNTKELITVLYKYTKGEFTPAKDYNEGDEEIFLRGKKCGHVFYTKAKPFFKNPICPKCKKEKELEKKHKHFQKRLYNKYGLEYTTATRYINYRTKIEFIHKNCGTVFSDIPQRILKPNIKEPCPVCKELKIKEVEKRKNRHLKTLYKKHKDKYSLIGEYIDSREKTLYKHNECGNEFEATPLQMIKRLYPCDKCKK